MRTTVNWLRRRGANGEPTRLTTSSRQTGVQCVGCAAGKDWRDPEQHSDRGSWTQPPGACCQRTRGVLEGRRRCRKMHSRCSARQSSPHSTVSECSWSSSAGLRRPLDVLDSRKTREKHRSRGGMATGLRSEQRRFFAKGALWKGVPDKRGNPLTDQIPVDGGGRLAGQCRRGRPTVRGGWPGCRVTARTCRSARAVRTWASSLSNQTCVLHISWRSAEHQTRGASHLFSTGRNQGARSPLAVQLWNSCKCGERFVVRRLTFSH
jgi:hypothetical protein